jgi:hypothetical protein
MNDERESKIDTAKSQVGEAIGAAEDIPDPLDGLVEKTASDPARPSRPKCWSGLRRRRKTTALRSRHCVLN